MGFISDMFSSGNGAGWQAQGANLQDPTSTAQAQTSYDQAQQGIAQQQAFLQALQAQNGIANQSDVYGQLQGVANGTGANPAQAMLANATGNNVANQAALMAGQRGASSNPGLIARQAAMQGAATQQQAAGQGAALQANQSLGALNTMGGLATQQVGQQAGALQNYNQFAQGEQQNILGGIQGQNNSHIANQNNLNTNNGAIAQGNQHAQSGLLGGVLGGVGGLIGLAKGGPVPPASGNGSYINDTPYLNEGVDASWDEVNPRLPAAPAPIAAPPASGPSSKVGQFLKSALGGDAAPEAAAPAFSGGQDAVYDGASKFMSGAASRLRGKGPVVDPNALAGAGDVAPMPMGGPMYAAQGGKVPALVSPGEVYIPPSKLDKAAKGNPLKEGEKIPGKPVVGGAKNSYANDTVPKKLEEGGIVIPRSHTQGPDAMAKSIKFLHAVMAKQRMKQKG